MVGKECIPELQRIRYKKRQMLSSQDLRDDADIMNLLRWMHNRALHEVHGVNSGMEICQLNNDGKQVDGEDTLVMLEISPGLAYDCYGRELILPQSRRIRVPLTPPDASNIFTLLVSYQENSAFAEKAAGIGGCASGDSVLNLEEPIFNWKPDSLVEIIDGVPLARVCYKEPKSPVLLNDSSKSPLSRPLARPRIASGATIPGKTAWEEWIEKDSGGRYTIGFQTRIDTSSAGFTETPCYFAKLQGNFWNEENPEFILAPFESIHEGSATGFTFRIMLPSLPPTTQPPYTNRDFLNSFFDFAQLHNIQVSWIGITGATCSPKPIAVLFATPTSGYAPLAVNFDGSYSYDPDGTIVSYAWDFGDGGTSDEMSPQHTYSNVDDYDVTLKVTDDAGNTDSATIKITVNESIPYIG